MDSRFSTTHIDNINESSWLRQISQKVAECKTTAIRNVVWLTSDLDSSHI